MTWGGTSDFSLIQVKDEDGKVGLDRIAVGEHILLGGEGCGYCSCPRGRPEVVRVGRAR